MCCFGLIGVVLHTFPAEPGNTGITPAAAHGDMKVEVSWPACIVGVARATSVTTSDSTVAHPADNSHGLPDAHATGENYSPKCRKQYTHTHTHTHTHMHTNIHTPELYDPQQ